jgi:uncharacterized membrane protein
MPTTLTWVAMAVTAASIAATAGFLGWAYGELPPAVATHYIRGEPVVYQFKSVPLVLLPVGVQLSLATVFGTLMLLVLWRARPHGDFVPVAGDADRMRHAAEGIALLSALWIAFQGLGAWRLVEMWLRGRGGYGAIYSVSLLAAIGLSMAIGVRTMKLVGRHRAATPPAIDPGDWVLRHLYMNARDPALYVPTRTGTGWTLNFGRPVAIVVLLSVLLIGFGVPAYLVWRTLRGAGW